MTVTLDEVKAKIDAAVVDDPEKGLYRGRREAFTDPEIFELEMKYIFEGNWIYLAHESQLQNNNDYLTTYMGRQPIVISRDKTGELHALINACSHRGAMLCRRKKDNRSTFTCPFHGWTFNNTGRLLKVKDPRGADYPEQFNKEGSHDLTKVPRFESYRGFLFGSLNPDVVPWKSTSAVRRRSSTWSSTSHRRAWRCSRAHPPTPTTGTGRSRPRTAPTATTSARRTGTTRPPRRAAAPVNRRTRPRRWTPGQWGKLRGGYYAWDKGHVLLWNEWGNPEDRPLWGRRDEFAQQFGQERRRLDAEVLPQPVSVPERVHHGPVRITDPTLPSHRRGPDRSHHLLHRPEGRERRGPSRADPPVRGFLQRQRHGHPGRSRRIPVLPEDVPGQRGPVERHEPRRRPLDRRGRRGGETLGLDPVSTGIKTEDEGLYITQHSYWQREMQAAVAAEAAEQTAATVQSNGQSRSN